MRTFPLAFTTEKNRKTGASPVWMMKCPFATGTVYLSDMVFSIASWNGGITTKSWVKEWGAIDEDISGDLSQSKVSDFSLQVLIDPNSTLNIGDILNDPSNNIETTDIELYLWFLGLDSSASPPQLMWAGNIIDYKCPDELAYQLDLVDQGVKLDKYVGTLLDADLYPRMDPADVGKVGNIIMGDVENVPCHCIVAGGAAALTADITATSPGNGGTLSVNDGSSFPQSGNFKVKVGDEIILCRSAHDTWLSLATSGARGADSTVAAAHGTDDPVVEYLAAYAYLVADNDRTITDHGVASVYDVRVDGELITDGVTVLLGGESYANNKTVVSLTHGPVDLNAYEAISPMNVTTGNNKWNNPGFCIDGDESTATNTYTSPSTDTLQVNFAPSSKKSPVVKQDVEVLLNVPLNITLTLSAGWTPSTVTNTGGTVTRSFTKTGGARSDAIAFTYSSSAYTALIYEVKPKKVYTYKLNPGGATAARVNVGSVVTVHAVTANPATAHYPDKVIGRLLNAYAGWSPDNFITDAATQFSTKGYKLSVLINEYKKLRTWLSLMAFQCRCYFRFADGKAFLLYRPDSGTSDKTLAQAMIRMNSDFKTTLKTERSSLDEIINKINLKYSRDWSKSGNDAYKSLTKATDPASIAKYGEKERADLFTFDFVRLSAMATDLRDFYLTRYKDRKRIFTMDVFLDNIELEFADAITLAPASNTLCEVAKVNITPGSGRDMRNDKIQLIVREY